MSACHSGDFNIKPHSSMYSLLTTGSLEPEVPTPWPYIHTCMHEYKDKAKYIYTLLPCILTYILAYLLHTYIHAAIHTYLHTHTYIHA